VTGTEAAATRSRHPLARLHDPRVVRARCAAILSSVERGVSHSFTIDRSRLQPLAERVAALTLKRFPDLQVPYHSRWRHFEAGGVDRKAELDALIANRPAHEQARIRFDLTVISVLLDAGAGPAWRYTEHQALSPAALPSAKPDDLLAMLDKAAAGSKKPVAAAEKSETPTAAAGATEAAAAETEVDSGADADPSAASGKVSAQKATEKAAAEAAATAASIAAAATAKARASAAVPTPSAAAAPPVASKDVYTRSEGLGVASFRAFVAGAFSAHSQDPLRADASALRHIDAAAVRAMFQSSPSNPIVGAEGRATLLSRLGNQLHEEAQRTGHEPRPALIFDRLSQGGQRTQVSATEVLGEVLRCLSPIWPSGTRVLGLPAGDVWPHRWAGAALGDGGVDRMTEGYVPFHKLSQWMTYSLLEPLQWAGIEVTGLQALTALPEYRNGGLLLDAGVIVPRNLGAVAKLWKPQDEFIVEWRALTVALIDEVAVLVRQILGKTEAELPLACILEGGTWAAGRELALELRAGGAPPLKIDSDGTVF